MKKWNGLLILSATLAILFMMLSGCGNSASAVDYANEEIEVKDSVVTSRVEQVLLADEQLSRLDLTVFTRKGVHTLHNHLSVQKSK
jgi:uncharacterized membrane protein